MRRIGEIVCFAILLTAGSSSSGQQLAQGESWEIPFRLYEGFAIVLRGSIGTLQDCNLLIDTGASPTLVDERIVRKLHLESTKSTLPTVAGNVPVAQTMIPTIEIGPFKKEGVLTAVRDLNALSERIGVHVDALVGLDVLGDSNLRINYERRVIAFSNDAAENTAGITALDSGAPLVVLPMTMNRQQIHVLFDTGSFGLVLFANHMADALPNSSEPDGPFRSIEGEIELRPVRVQDAAIGDLHLGPSHAFLARGPNGASFDGVLGPKGLNAREVLLDLKRGQLAWH